MKKAYGIIVLMVLLSISGVATAGDYVPVPPPSSFRGMAWGTSLADLPDMLPVQESGFKNTYFRTDERMTFGDATIRSVAYYFREGRLYRVGVAFSGRANHFLIKERLISMYGRGRGVGLRYGWMWPNFSVEINYDDEADSGGLFYTYEGAWEQAEGSGS